MGFLKPKKGIELWEKVVLLVVNQTENNCTNTSDFSKGFMATNATQKLLSAFFFLLFLRKVSTAVNAVLQFEKRQPVKLWKQTRFMEVWAALPKNNTN